MSHLPESLVSQSPELQECCDQIAEARVFGFDTEFIGEESYRPRLCLVQVATPDRLFLIDPLAVEDLTPFWELVADPNHVTVVHAGREEIRMCAHHLGRPPANVFDLQVAAGLVGRAIPPVMPGWYINFSKYDWQKGETLTDWSRRPLTKHQVRYAYDDVRFLIPLYDKLVQQLTDLDRQSWAMEEFAALQSRSIDGDPEREPWRKLRGLGGLNRQELAVVREVFCWRDERAKKTNRPARFMLRDDLIVEVARRQPSNEHDLALIRGVTKHDLAGLLAASERGRQSLQSEWPEAAERDNDPPQVPLIASFLLAALGSYCAEQHLTPALAATSQDVKHLVRDYLSDAAEATDSPLHRGWRAQYVLPFLQSLLIGRRAMLIGKAKTNVPFDFVDVKT